MSSPDDTLPIRPPALRPADLQRLALIIAGVALIAVVFYTLLAFSAQLWPVLGVAAICLIGGLLYIGVYVWAGQGQTKRAMRVMVGTVAVLLPAVGFFLSGLEVLFALATPMLVFILANIMFHRWRAVLWGVNGVIGGVAALFIDRLPLPFERTEVADVPALQLFAVGITLGVGAVLVWQGLRLYQNIELIRIRLLAAFVAAALVPVLLIGAAFGGVSFYAGQRIMIEQTEVMAALKWDAVEMWLTHLESSLSNALHPYDVEMLVDPLVQAQPDSREYWRLYGALETYFEAFLDSVPAFEAVALMDAEGKVIFSTRSHLLNVDRSEAPDFQNGQEGFYASVLGPGEMAVARPVTELAGVLSVYIDMIQLQRILSEDAGLGEYGEVYLVDAGGSPLTPLLYPAPADAVLESEGIAEALEGRTLSGAYTNYYGEPVLGAYRYMPALDAVLVAERSSVEARELLNLVAVVGGAVLALTVLVAVGIALFMARSIASPIDILVDAAIDVAEGNLKRTVAVVREDEIGKLARAFNSMTLQLRGIIGQLAGERNLMRTLIDSLPDQVAIKDAHSHILIANEALADFLDAESPEALVGKTVADFMPLEAAQQDIEDERAVIESGKPRHNVEVYLPRSEGERWMLLTQVPIHDETGEVYGLVAVARDNTERKRIELENQRLAALIEVSPDFVGIAAPDGQILYLNPGALKMTGYPPDTDVTTLHITDFQSYSGKDWFATAMEEGTWIGEATLRHRNGDSIPVSQLITVLKDEDGNVLSLNNMSRDISERVAMEKELRASEAELRESEEALRAAVAEYLDFVQRVAQGDLTARLELSQNGRQHRDDLYRLGKTLNAMVGSLSSMTQQIRAAATGVSAAAAEIQAATTQQTANATQQDVAIGQTMATVEEVRATVGQTADRARQVAESSQQSVDVSRSGQEAVANTSAGMQRIRDRVGDIAENILMLSERTQQIGEIIAAVNDIADQSKMLALNASIEAARAGEEGKGFAVVAMEVRQLAERSREATARVRDILQEIQGATNTAVMVTEEGTKGADQGIELVEYAGEAIRDLSGIIEEAAHAAEQIAASTHQQTNGMEQLGAAMASIKQASAQTASSTRQAERSAQDLMEMARQMEAAVAQYQIDDAR